MTTSDQMIINGFGTKGLAELNHHMRDEQKETRGGGSGEGRVLLEEDESRINEDVEDRDRTESVQAQAAVIQRQQQQPQGHIVRWERFLHVRSLKVLLVENDDSTRHVVSAFLRNCSYEVTAVENGLQAWKILEDLTNHIDLVLTEVVVPFLSGFGLLQKIMSHNICKNIPVIMMSSHDSVGIVFKCLSKGAVDFLVKPIRKNELKNLWQHVWRKCRSSSGSASESGVRTLKSAKLESAEESDNSNDEDNNGSIGPNDRNGSDHGSGTQSSWTKLAVEVDSPQPMSQLNQLADPPYSTYGRVNYSRAKAFSDNLVSTTATRKRHEQDDELVFDHSDKSAIGKDLNIGVPKQPNLQLEFPTDKVLNNTVGINKDKILESNSRKEQFKKGQMTLNTEKLRNPAADLIDVVANSTDPQIESLNFEIPNGDSYISESKDKAIYDTKEMSSLEISLKWLTDIEDNGTSANTRNIWRHSNLSAFSRYNSSATANQAPTGNVGSYLPPDKSSEAAKTEPMHNFQSNSDGYLPFQRSNGTSNNNDMGSTTNNAFTKPAVFNDKPAPVKFLNLSSAFQPVQNSHISPRQPNLPSRADAVTANTVLAQARETHQQVQVHHRHHHYFHHHHHHVHNLPQQQQLPKDEELSLKNMSAAAQQCGSSNVWRAPISGNVGNHSLNGSASGSNHGSNGQNGSSIAVNNGGINMENDIDIFENGGGAVSGSGRSGEYQNHLARRVAALNKFRLKRKDRCFDKKVRYQSRKRLAEQRPRVRGQFVRQVACADKIEDTDS